ncbi:uncharacterized protein LOC114189512 [Vigna unguiculata]|uniref:uncharacterized protein LOC114189512 n=1 Tax=Vigna unguiculata TaxID=3917 RepID=UPI001016DAF0|nr:uncharacterized protein LOC114189512 [Vigna unguiculata]
MALMKHSMASSLNAVKTDIEQHTKEVRNIHENQMRMERSTERASPRGSLHGESNVRKERKSSWSRSPPQKPEWDDQEAKRKRRVAKYKHYEVEGKVKSSLKEGFHTFKFTCKKVVATLV